MRQTYTAVTTSAVLQNCALTFLTVKQIPLAIVIWLRPVLNIRTYLVMITLYISKVRFHKFQSNIHNSSHLLIMWFFYPVESSFCEVYSCCVKDVNIQIMKFLCQCYFYHCDMTAYFDLLVGWNECFEKKMLFEKFIGNRNFNVFVDVDVILL